jgi:hypothetical protein
MRAYLTIAAALGLLAVGPTSAFAQFYGPGPWCAVVNTGWGNVQWDCRYSSIQQCQPNVIAGNRGFCSRNPSYVGSQRSKKSRRSAQ